jgi:hypothetical protein
METSKRPVVTVLSVMGRLSVEIPLNWRQVRTFSWLRINVKNSKSPVATVPSAIELLLVEIPLN